MQEMTCEVGGKLYRLVNNGGCRICAFIGGSIECSESGNACFRGSMWRWVLDEMEDELCKLRETVARLSVAAMMAEDTIEDLETQLGQSEDQIAILEENARRYVGIFGVCVESEYLSAGDHVAMTPCGRVVKCV